jgi:hypothetical protein
MIKILESNTQISGQIEEISRRGIGIYTKEKVLKGSRVNIKIFCDVGSGPLDYNLSGTIRTEEKKKEFGSIGIEFEKEMNSIDHSELYKYLISQEQHIDYK